MFTFSLSHAQTLVEGKVIDENGDAIPFATVLIEGTTIGTSTNDEGVFNLNSKARQKLIGYTP